MKLIRRTKELAVDFCERCGKVCDSACRQDAIIERARERVLLNGARFL